MSDTPTEEASSSEHVRVLPPEVILLTGTEEGEISVPEYGSQFKRSWSLRGPNGSSSLCFFFSSFSSEKNFDKLKIYEKEDGTGPLVAVLSGTFQNKTIQLGNSSSSSSSASSSTSASSSSSGFGAYVVFTSDHNGGGKGFHGKYKFS